MHIGEIVKLTKVARNETYEDMDWKNDELQIVDIHKDNCGTGPLYSFISISSNLEITCSMYRYELRRISK